MVDFNGGKGFQLEIRFRPDQGLEQRRVIVKLEMGMASPPQGGFPEGPPRDSEQSVPPPLPANRYKRLSNRGLCGRRRSGTCFHTHWCN